MPYEEGEKVRAYLYLDPDKQRLFKMHAARLGHTMSGLVERFVELLEAGELDEEKLDSVRPVSL